MAPPRDVSVSRAGSRPDTVRIPTDAIAEAIDWAVVPRGLDGIVADLRALRVAAGEPSYREIAARVTERRARRGVPDHEGHVARSTVYDCFRPGRKRVDLDLVAELGAALGLAHRLLDDWRDRRRLERLQVDDEVQRTLELSFQTLGENAAQARADAEAEDAWLTANLDTLLSVAHAAPERGEAELLFRISDGLSWWLHLPRPAPTRTSLRRPEPRRRCRSSAVSYCSWLV